MVGIKNESGIINARYGYWNGLKCLFTHRDPKNAMLYGEDILTKENGKIMYGKWIPSDEVTLI